MKNKQIEVDLMKQEIQDLKKSKVSEHYDGLWIGKGGGWKGKSGEEGSGGEKDDWTNGKGIETKWDNGDWKRRGGDAWTWNQTEKGRYGHIRAVGKPMEQQKEPYGCSGIRKEYTLEGDKGKGRGSDGEIKRRF